MEEVVLKNRTVINKLNNVEGSAFERMFDVAFQLTKTLMNEIVCWGHDEVYTKEFEWRNLKIDRDNLYKYTDGSISKKDFFKILGLLYELLMDSNFGINERIYSSTLFGKPKSSVAFERFDILKDSALDTLQYSAKELFGEDIDIKPEKIVKIKEFVSKKVGHKSGDKFKKAFDCEVENFNVNKKAAKLCRQLMYKLKSIGYFDRKPFSFDGINTTISYIAFKNVTNMITSWEECNKSRKESYIEEERSLADKYLKIGKSAKLLQELFVFCTAQQKDGTIILRSFDDRVRRHLCDCVIPAWKRGDKPDKLYYECYDSKTEKIRQVKYSLHNSFYDELYKHKELWDNSDEPTDSLICKHWSVFEDCFVHSKHRPAATFPFMGAEDVNRFQFLCGNNYQNFSFEAQGDTIKEDLNYKIRAKKGSKEMSFVDGRKIDALNVSIDCEDFLICMKRRKKNKDGSPTGRGFDAGAYFQNAELYKCKDKGLFLIKSDRHASVIKEPSIVKSNGEYYIRLNMGVLAPEIDDIVNDAYWLLNSGRPISKSKRKIVSESAKNKKRFGSCKGTTLNVLGIDLGMKNIAAFALAKTKIQDDFDNFELIESGLINDPDFDKSKYIELRQILRVLKRMIGVTRSISKDFINDDLEDSYDCRGIESIISVCKNILIRKIKDFENNKDKSFKKKVKIWESFCKKDSNQHLSELRRMIIKYDGDLEKIKKDPAWLVNIVYKCFSWIYGEVKNERIYSQEKEKLVQNDFIWVEIIRDFIKVKNSLSQLGRNNDDGKNKIDLDKIWKYYNNCKSNLLKQSAASIIKTAIKFGVDVIVLEELSSIKRKSKADNNELLAHFSAKKIFDTIKNAAEIHGILIATVSANSTSRVHFETGNLGYRDWRGLHCEDSEGKIITVDADVNAAKNIAYRYTSRHQNIFCVDLNKVAESDNKRIQGFLTHKFGSVNIGVSELKKKDLQEKKGSKLVYFSGSDCFGSNKRKEQIQRIKDKLNI